MIYCYKNNVNVVNSLTPWWIYKIVFKIASKHVLSIMCLLIIWSECKFWERRMLMLFRQGSS